MLCVIIFLKTWSIAPIRDNGMQKTSQNKIEWKMYKEVSISWATYDAHRLSECKRVLDLRNLFIELDKPVQRRGI